MKNKKYWEDRMLTATNQIYDDLNKKNIELKKFYKVAMDDLEKEIAVSLSKINKGAPTLSDMYKFNRLNNLKSDMGNIIESLGNNIEKHTKNQIISAINEAYKNTGSLIAVIFSMPSETLIKKLMENPWSGKLFSDRIWDNQKLLNKELNKTLKNGLIQGKSINKITNELSKAMNSGFKNTNRLVRTETMHFLNEASKENFKDHGIKKVQVLVAGDERTCPKCMEHDNVVYNIGSISLPIHPHCRCCFIPIIETLSKNDEKNLVKESLEDDIINSKIWLNANFASQKKFNKHIDKHIHEYGDISPTEYLSQARNLLANELNKDIDGFVSNQGWVFKYRHSTNDFALGSDKGTISTFYKPIEKYEYFLGEKDKYK